MRLHGLDGRARMRLSASVERGMRSVSRLVVGDYREGSLSLSGQLETREDVVLENWFRQRYK